MSSSTRPPIPPGLETEPLAEYISHAPRPIKSIASVSIGVLLTVLTMASAWLIAGRDWLEQNGENRKQIAINTARLDRVEEQQRTGITREEHQQLLLRLGRIEEQMVTREEMQESGRARDLVLSQIAGELRDIQVQLTQLRVELHQHEVATQTAHSAHAP